MTTTYYDRPELRNLDGRLVFAADEDRAAETEVSKAIEWAWSCRLHHFGAMCALDWYATRNGAMVGLLELKNRPHPSTKYPTVFLNVRKWLALQLGANGLGTPAIFVARFTDCIKWQPVSEIDATDVRIGGCKQRVKSESDVEPVIHVPIHAMHELDTR